VYEPQRSIEIPLKKDRIPWRPLLLVMAFFGWLGFIHASLHASHATSESTMMIWSLTALAFTLLGLSASPGPGRAHILIDDEGLLLALGTQIRSLKWGDIQSWRWSDPMTERLLEQTANLPPETEFLVDHTPEAGNSLEWVLVIQPKDRAPLSFWAKKCIHPEKAESALRSALVCNCPHQVIRDPRQGVVHVHQHALG